MGLGCDVDFNVMASVGQERGYYEDPANKYAQDEPEMMNENRQPESNKTDWTTIHKLYTPKQVMRAMAILATISSMLEEEEAK